MQSGGAYTETNIPHGDEISIAELAEIVRRFAFVIAVAMMVVGTASWWLVDRRPDAFLGQARLLATQLDPAIAQLSASVATARPLDAAAYRSAALSRPLLQAATEELAVAGHTALDLTRLDERLSVTTSEARLSLQITIGVRSPDASDAALMANAIAEALVRWDVDRAMDAIARVTQALGRQVSDIDAQIESYASSGNEAMVAALQAVRAEAERNLAAARMASTTISGNLEILEPAIVADEPEPKSSILVAVLAAVVTGFGLLVLALLREAMSNKLGGIDGVATQSRQPILGTFPTDPSGSRRLPPEAAGYVRSNLQFLVPADHPLVLLVTSGLAGEGKTSVTIAIAEAYARSEYRTAVVDADGRHPTLTGTLRADGPTTRPWQKHGEPDAEAGVAIPLGRHRSLDVFGLAHPLNGEECRLLGRAFGHLAERVKDRYDVIVVDSAPLLPVADTLALAPQASAVVLVISLEEATRHTVRDTLSVLDRVGANVVGVVATHVPKRGPRGSGPYGYGYGYGDDASVSEESGDATIEGRASMQRVDHAADRHAPPTASEVTPTGRDGSMPKATDGDHDRLPLIEDEMIRTDWRGHEPLGDGSSQADASIHPIRRVASSSDRA